MLSLKRYTPTEGYNYIFKPGELGRNYLQFGILNLKPDSTFFDHSDDCEVVLVLLAGKCTLLVGHSGNKANGILGTRENVFTDDGNAAFIPHHTTFEVVTGTESVELVFCKTPSHKTTASVILEIGKIESPTDYKLHVFEELSTDEIRGEAVCFYRFQDETGSATIQAVESEKDQKQFTLQNNDVILVPEKQRIRILNYEGILYQLIIKRFIHPQ